MIDFVLRNLIELATLPGSVPKLRGFILDQAVRGNLTAGWRREHPEVEPASVQLEQIREEKRQLIQAGKIKKQKELPPVDLEEVPFQVPESWEWVRLGSIGRINGGFAFKSSNYVDDGMRVVRISDFDEYGFRNNRVVRHKYDVTLRDYLLDDGDILMAMTGGTVGKSLLVTSLPEPMVVNQRVATIRIESGVESHYVHDVLRTEIVRSVIASAKNSTNDNISMADISGFMVSLPPTNEQTEIVRRVDELMALCDQLEAVQTRRDDTRRRALAVGAAQLTDDTTTQSFADIWPRFTARLPELVQHPDDIKPVQDAILQLAVRGHLTADWRATHPDTEPASSLIARIKEEKQAMVKAGKIKKQKELPPVDPEEVPFEVPEGWEWTRPLELGVSSPRNHLGGETRVGFVPMQLVPEAIFATNSNEGRPWSSVKSGFTHIADGDVCIAKITPSFENGKGCVISSLPNGAGAATTELHVLRPIPETVDPWYLFVFYRSDLFRSIAIPKMTGTAGQKRVTRPVFEETPIPLPPKDEQSEIVHRIDDLMASCNQLAAKHGNRATQADQVLTTALGTVS